MKVLMVTSHLKCGGAESFTVSLHEQLTAMGVEIHLLNLNFNNFTSENPLENNLRSTNNYRAIPPPPHAAKITGNRITRKLFFTVLHKRYRKRLAVTLRTMIETIRPDVILTNQLNADRLVATCGMGIPHVIVDQGDYRGSFPDKRQLLDNCSHIVCVSDDNRRRLLQSCGNPNVSTIHNSFALTDGTPPAPRSRYGIPEEAFVFIMAARGIPEKGWIHALKAFEAFRYNGQSCLILAGTGGGIDEARSHVSQRHSKGVVFTGFIENPFETLAFGDVAMLPSHFPSESLPLTLVEALHAGLPLIATRIGGIPEIIEHPDGNCGILVDLKDGTPDIGQLTRSMEEMFENRDHYARNVSHCSRKFNLALRANDYVSVLNSAITGIHESSSSRA